MITSHHSSSFIVAPSKRYSLYNLRCIYKFVPLDQRAGSRCILHPTVTRLARPRLYRGRASRLHLTTSRTQQRQTRNREEKEARERQEAGGRQPASRAEQSPHAATRIGTNPKLHDTGAGAALHGPHRAPPSPASRSRSPSLLPFPLALRLHQLEPLPSTHHAPPDLPSLIGSSSFPLGRNAARRAELAAGMPAQKRPLPSSASPGSDADVEEAPGADADGCGGADQRSPKVTLNGVEERDGGPLQAKDQRHGTTGLSTTRGPPTRVIFSRCAYASRGAASLRVSLSACFSGGLGRFRR